MFKRVTWIKLIEHVVFKIELAVISEISEGKIRELGRVRSVMTSENSGSNK